MSTVNLKILSGLMRDLSDEKLQELYSETLFMVLAGAARADLNIEAIEVKRIVKILKDRLDKDFTEAEIKLAGEAKLHDRETVRKYVGRASSQLSVSQRQEIIAAMLEVFESDGTFGPLETDYFNRISVALALTPLQIASAR